MNKDFQKKAEYLRSLGYSALADDIEQLAQQVASLQKETKMLRERIVLLLKGNR